MIKANELRIGNWVLYRDNNEEKEFKPVQIGVPDLVLISEGLKDVEYSPIELSPDWLERAGFKYKPCGISGADMWQGMGFWFPKPNGMNSEIVFRGGFSRTRPIVLKLAGFFNTNCQYVHELQNGYQWLTGEELIFNHAAADKTKEGE